MQVEIIKPSKEMRDEAYRISFFADEALTQCILDDAVLLREYVDRHKTILEQQGVIKSGSEKRNVELSLLTKGDTFVKKTEYLFFLIPGILLFVVYLYFFMQSKTEYKYAAIVIVFLFSFICSICMVVLHIVRNKQTYFVDGIPNENKSPFFIISIMFMLLVAFIFLIYKPVFSILYILPDVESFNTFFQNKFLIKNSEVEMSSHFVIATLAPSLFILSVAEGVGWHNFHKQGG